MPFNKSQALVGRDKEAGMTIREQIIQYFGESPNASMAEAARHIGVSRAWVSFLCKELGLRPNHNGLTVKEYSQKRGFSEGGVYAMIEASELPATRVGKCLVIPYDARKRLCPICGEERAKWKKRYCSSPECLKAGRRQSHNKTSWRKFLAKKQLAAIGGETRLTVVIKWMRKIIALSARFMNKV